MTEILHAILGTKKALATIAVKNIDVARKFYQEVLGLEPAGSETPGVLSLASASTLVLLYESQYAGTNQATAATWIVDSQGDDKLENVVAALKNKGIVFEHYDFPGGQREGDIHIFGRIRNAWFKDPDGNILSVVSEA